MISENGFLLRNKKIWIYAAGSIGAVLLQLLKMEHLNVQGFIDRRAHSIQRYHGLPVKTLEEAAKSADLEDYAVIITVRNVFEHSSIAEQLYRAGFRNLIFKPLDRIWGEKTASYLQIIDKAHDALLVDIQIPDFPIPTAQDSCGSKQEKTMSIRHVEKDVLCVSIPVEKLIFNHYEDNIWSNIPALGYFPAIELYQSFNGSAFISLQESLDQYIEVMASYGAGLVEIKQSEDWRKNTLEARHSVYVEMDLLFQMKPDFFERSCPSVKWNERGCFELTSSGKNRVSFLIAKGFSYVPVKMPAVDFERWRNAEACQAFSHDLRELGQPLFCSVPHPDYYHQPVQTPEYLQKWILPICMMLTKSIRAARGIMNFADYCIYDQNFDQGALSRALSLFGFRLIRGEADGLTRSLDRLLQFKSCEVPRNPQYYAATLNSEVSEEETRRLLERTERFFFYWTEDAQTCRISWIEQMGFVYRNQICACISAGKIMKGLQFERSEKHLISQGGF